MNQLIVKFREHKRMVEDWESDIAPRVRKLVNVNMDLAIQCNVLEADNGKFKVFDFPKKATHVVKWEDGSCTCRSWQLTGIPCQHVLATASHQDVDGDFFVHEYYKKEKWMLAYGTNLDITRGPEMWCDWPGERPQPPEARTGPGRPRKNRRKPKGGEVKRYRVARCKAAVVTKLTRVGRVLHCSICRSPEHTKRKCPLNPDANLGSSTRQQPPTNNNAEPGTSTSKPKKGAAAKAPSTSNLGGRRRLPAAYFKPRDTNTQNDGNGKGKRKAHGEYA